MTLHYGDDDIYNIVVILRVQFVAPTSCKFPYFSFHARVGSIGFLFLPASVEIISRSYILTTYRNIIS